MEYTLQYDATLCNHFYSSSQNLSSRVHVLKLHKFSSSSFPSYRLCCPPQPITLLYNFPTRAGLPLLLPGDTQSKFILAICLGHTLEIPYHCSALFLRVCNINKFPHSYQISSFITLSWYVSLCASSYTIQLYSLYPNSSLLLLTCQQFL